MVLRHHHQQSKKYSKNLKMLAVQKSNGIYQNTLKERLLVVKEEVGCDKWVQSSLPSFLRRLNFFLMLGPTLEENWKV